MAITALRLSAEMQNAGSRSRPASLNITTGTLHTAADAADDDDSDPDAADDIAEDEYDDDDADADDDDVAPDDSSALDDDEGDSAPLCCRVAPRAAPDALRDGRRWPCCCGCAAEACCA